MAKKHAWRPQGSRKGEEHCPGCPDEGIKPRNRKGFLCDEHDVLNGVMHRNAIGPSHIAAAAARLGHPISQATVQRIADGVHRPDRETLDAIIRALWDLRALTPDELAEMYFAYARPR